MVDYTRQLDLLPPEHAAAVHIDLVGVGGEGSPVAPMLGKMGFVDLRVFDPDVVRSVNLSSQWFRLEDARFRRPKVHACQAICREFAEVKVEAVFDDATRHDLRGIVILCLDSMATRADLWDRIRQRPQVEWLIDARMGAEQGTILTVQPMEPTGRRYYESTLFDDTEAVALPCTRRAIVYNTLWIAALLCNQVKRIAMNQPVYRRIDFDLAEYMLVVE